ncbi:MAG: tetratricopeptide repeat protein [Mangrovibacterium sp.]
MKKIILVIAISLAISGGAFAQKGKVSAAQANKDSGNLEKAKELIDVAVDPNNEKAAKSIPWAKTWMVRGDIYAAIPKDDKLKSTVENPLDIALESYKKAIELDEKGQFTSLMKVGLTQLTSTFTNAAVDCFKTNDYKGAFNDFEKVLEINALPVYAEDEQFIDTTIIFNTGLAAFNAEMYDDAIKYYEEAAKYGYQGASMYDYIMMSYLNKQDTVGAIEALQAGFKKYPEGANIVTNMINLFLQTGRTDDAITYLKIAIKQDPSNASFHFAQGALFDQLKDYDNAIAAYEKAIELKPDYFDPYYNLGVIYFNKGVAQLDKANAVPANQAKLYEEEKEKANVEFKKAVPFMEKASEVNPKDTYSLESLKQLYYRLNDIEKRDAVQAKLDALNNAQ